MAPLLSFTFVKIINLFQTEHCQEKFEIIDIKCNFYVFIFFLCNWPRHKGVYDMLQVVWEPI